MAGQDRFHAFVTELFAAVDSVTIRSMFGGAGVYARGRMFALLADETIYLKVDDALKARLKEAGSGPFTWRPESGPKAGVAVEMGYWRLPDTALDDPEEAAMWGSAALAVALAKPPAKKKRKA
ncbi:MAG: TfoX/Sxy family protein [Caulobacterales bacterium]|jgi:DNA transformation protein